MTQSEVIELLANIARSSSSVNGDNFLSVLKEKYDQIIAKLKEMNIEYDDLGGNTISISEDIFEKHNIKVYGNKGKFFGDYEDTDRAVIILGDKNNDSVISYDKDGDITYKLYSSNVYDHVTTNFYYLKKIIELLSQENITDYKDTSHDQYFFLSPDCGKLKMYEGETENLVEISKSNVNLINTYKEFFQLNKYQQGWEPIFRNKIIRGLENVDKEKERFKKLILDLPLYIEATNRDYELLAISNTRETLIKQFEREIYGFADKIRAVLERISSTIISIPLTFIGAVIAIRDIHQSWLMNIIIGTIIVFIIITGVVNYLFWKDLSIIKKEIEMVKNIKSMQVKHLQKEFEVIIKPIFSRIKFIKGLIIGIITIFVLLFVFFICQYFCAPKIHTIFI